MSTIGIHPPEWLLAGSHPTCPAVPEKIRYPSTNETLEIKDHQIVFQLAAKLNELNGGDPKLSVDFIPWIQNSDNAPYYYNGIRNADGTVPTVRTTNDLPGGEILGIGGLTARMELRSQKQRKPTTPHHCRRVCKRHSRR